MSPAPLAPQFLLAPIKGTTDRVYRDAFGRCFRGFDRAVAPYLRTRSGQPLRAVDLDEVDPAGNRHLRTIPQVLAKTADPLAEALAALYKAGHAEVNWNLGCPTRNVAGRGFGAGLLAHPRRIDEILERILPETPVRLSVKIRLGYRDADEYRPVLDVLNRHPLTEVILHARTAEQMYRGACDVERAREALDRCRHPFLYNGDIRDVEGFHALQERLPGVSGWMLGRGALERPLLPSLLAGGEGPQDYRAALSRFHDLLYDGYTTRLRGPRHLLDWMKGQWLYLARSFANPEAVRIRVSRTKDLPEYLEAVRWAFAQLLG